MALVSSPFSATVPLPAQVNQRRRGAITSASLSPPPVVDWVQETASFFKNDTRPIMLFDGVCNLCNGGVKFVRDNDRERFKIAFVLLDCKDVHEIEKSESTHFVRPWQPEAIPWRKILTSLKSRENIHKNIRFEALQSEAGKKLLQRSRREPDDISSVVLVEKDRSYIKSEAVLKIMKYINLPFPQLAFFLQLVPLFLRDFVYDNVAVNRYNFFGRSDSCEL